MSYFETHERGDYIFLNFFPYLSILFLLLPLRGRKEKDTGTVMKKRQNFLSYFQNVETRGFYFSLVFFTFQLCSASFTVTKRYKTRTQSQRSGTFIFFHISKHKRQVTLSFFSFLSYAVSFTPLFPCFLSLVVKRKKRHKQTNILIKMLDNFHVLETQRGGDIIFPLSCITLLLLFFLRRKEKAAFPNLPCPPAIYIYFESFR